MQFADHFFQPGDVRLHYLEGPRNGQPLVLIHGATGSCNEWGTVEEELGKDWHLFILDQRGHGQSGRGENPDGYHVSHYIADTLAFLREVVREPAVVWGHSWGAVVAMLSAGAARQYLRGVILEDPPVMVRREMCDEIKPFMDYFGMLLQLKQSVSSLDEMKEALRQIDQGATDDGLAPWAANINNVDASFLRAALAGPEIVSGIDFASAIRAADMPVLLMQADPAAGAALVQEDLDFVLASNPAFQLVQFPGAGHGIHHDQPDKVLRVFRQFANQLV